MNAKEIRKSLLDFADVISQAMSQPSAIELPADDFCISGTGYGEALANSTACFAREQNIDVISASFSSLLKRPSGKKTVMIRLAEDISALNYDQLIDFSSEQNPLDGFVTAMVLLARATEKKTVQAESRPAASLEKQVEELLKAYDRAYLEQLADRIEKAVGEYPDGVGIDFIGEGAQLPVIQFVRILMAESFGVFSSYENSEDWHHINVFLRNSGKMFTPMILREESPSYIRMKETVAVCQAIERELVVLADTPTENSKGVITVRKCAGNWISTLMDCYLLAYVSALMCERIR